MKKELIYLRIVGAIILTFLLWFGLAPIAFNVEPILGAIVVIVAPILDYWLIKPIFKNKQISN